MGRLAGDLPVGFTQFYRNWLDLTFRHATQPKGLMSEPEVMGRLAYRLYQIAWIGLDWLFPPLCGGCRKPGARWCVECELQTQTITEPVCKLCGQPLHEVGICKHCQDSPPVYTALRSWAFFQDPLRQAVHQLKYAGDIALGEILARPLLSLLKNLRWQVDLVVPVPIGVARRSERGYNQAALLALPVALGSGMPYQPKALRKVRETRSQVGLAFAQRYENVMAAFVASNKIVCNQCVLVVDDVTTSGATMEACAYALVQAGARQVYGLTLARAGM